MAPGKKNGRPRGRSAGRSDVRTNRSFTATSQVLKTDMTSCMRIGLLGAIAIGVVCFLFYPDLVRIARTIQSTEADGKRQGEAAEQNDPLSLKRTAEERDKRNMDPLPSEDDEDDSAEEIIAESDLFDDDSSDEIENVVLSPSSKEKTGDLMIDEEDSEIDVMEKKVELVPEGLASTDREDLKGKDERQNLAGKPMKMKVVGQDQSEPFKLSESGGSFKLELEPSPEVDGGKSGRKEQEKTKNTQTSKKKATGKAKAKSVNEQKKKGKKKAKKEDTKKDSNSELPKEVRDFKPVILDKVTPKKIFADGRRIPPIELLHQKPSNSSVKVFLFEEFLSKEECDGLRRVHDKHVNDTQHSPVLCFDSIKTLRRHLKEAKRKLHVTPNDFTEGTTCVNASLSRQLASWLKGNWSYSTAFYPGESRFSEIFAQRVHQAMGLLPGNGGKFQITSYPQGKAYKAHTDCIVDGQDKRDRIASVLVYLDDVEDGGETKFPELGIWVRPRKGRALVWNNMDEEGRCEEHSLHEASKVNKGSKYILIRWYYYQSFYSLGKRPPEPSLPARPPGSPRVSCDEYEHGSCRWYDEWNYDHLIEYERRKLTLI